MPLPSASKLYYPHPKPETVEQHTANLQQQAAWAERLPFFGASANYHVFPSAGITTTATAYPNIIPDPFTDFTTASTFPYSGGANGLYFPYQKQEDWTSIRIDASIGCYGQALFLALYNRMVVPWFLVKPIEFFTNGYSSKPDIPPDQVGNPDGLQSIRNFFINAGAVHVSWTDTLILPPHQRGVWAAQFHWYCGGGAGTLAMDQNDRWRIVITECPPSLPPYAGEVA